MSEYAVFLGEEDEYTFSVNENPFKKYHFLTINELNEDGDCEGELRFTDFKAIKKLAKVLNDYIENHKEDS